MPEEALNLFKRVLSHCVDKAKKATRTEKGDSLLGKEFLDMDISSFEKDTEEILRQLTNSRTNINFMEVINNHRKLLNDAFSTYITDLQASRVEFSKNFKTSLKLENTDKEISLAQQYQSYVSA